MKSAIFVGISTVSLESTNLFLHLYFDTFEHSGFLCEFHEKGVDKMNQFQT